MIMRYELYMDGTSLSSISDRIVVTDIKYAPAVRSFNQSKVAHRGGYIISNGYYDKTSVQVTFSVREYSIRERQSIIQNICKWADGRILETSDRIGQRLKCKCVKYPDLSALNWTENLSMTFQSDVNPLWESKFMTEIQLTGTSGSSSVFVEGSAGESLVEAEITTEATLNTVTLTVGETSMTIAKSDMGNVVLSYNEKSVLSIKHSTTSLLPYRTGSDDLLAKCGAFNQFSFSSNASCTVKFKTRGCWH